MDPVLQEKLLDLLVNFVSIILGGGIILLIIEWRRHQREKHLWEREDQLLEIDIPRADVLVQTWQITDSMSDKEKVTIYKNKLEGTISELLVVAHFVIRNTTSMEIIVTSYVANLLHIPPPSGRGPLEHSKRFYELETADLISKDHIGAIKLRPYSTIAREVILQNSFHEERRLDTVPSTLVIRAETSSGVTVQGVTSLNLVPFILDIEKYAFVHHPKKYLVPLDSLVNSRLSKRLR